MRHATESRGFTLIEMIVAMVIGGLLLAMVGMFGRHQIDAYVEVSARMQLADAADTALGRMEREIRAPCPTASGFPAITWDSLDYPEIEVVEIWNMMSHWLEATTIRNKYWNVIHPRSFPPDRLRIC